MEKKLSKKMYCLTCKEVCQTGNSSNKYCICHKCNSTQQKFSTKYLVKKMNTLLYRLNSPESNAQIPARS